MKNLILFSLFCTSVMAQNIDLAKDLEGSQTLLITLEDTHKKNLEKLKADEKSLEDLVSLKANRRNIQDSVLKEIDQKMNSFSFTQRLLSKKKPFYKCLYERLSKFGVAQVSECQRLNATKLSDEEVILTKGWVSKVGLSEVELDAKITSLKSSIANTQHEIKDYPTKVIRINNGIKVTKDKIFLESQKNKDQRIVKENESIANCNESSPEINLEEKIPFPGAKIQGPFYNVPRDNQDGLGTCYANAAKNLLVGLSGGENVASFLDMALQFKKQSNDINFNDGLSSGGSCPTLEAIAKEGYCPQKYAPAEIGDRNMLGEGLISSDADDVYGQLSTLNAVRSFISKRDSFTKDNSILSEKILSKGKTIIEKLKANPEIKLPLPGARFDIPEAWHLKATFDRLKPENKGNLAFEDFRNEYASHYKQFGPKFVQMLQAGSSVDQIFKTYQSTLAPFINKYGFQDELSEYERIFKTNIKEEYSDPNFKKSLRDSLNFLKTISGNESAEDEEFLKSCYDENFAGTKFLGDLQSLVNFLENNKMDPKALYDENGKIRNTEDLMQLLVAPSCLDKKNRRQLNFEFTCNVGGALISEIKKSTKPEAEKIRDMRNEVVASLVQGVAVGNSFQNHINTIVGMRFNPQTKSCEYRIRESQIGQSLWVSEKQIFDKIESLTIVRKK